MSIDADGLRELRDLLRESGFTDDSSEVLDGPFQDKPLSRPEKTRFSDGTVRVFYSALDPETAKVEGRSWVARGILEGAQAPRRFVYRMTQCEFGGSVKDLRPRTEEWPFLVAHDGGERCRTIGAEAVSEGLSALLTYSARRGEGTNLPVFRRDSLSNAVELEYFAFECDPTSGNVIVIAV